MSTLVGIEAAVDQLPSAQQEQRLAFLAGVVGRDTLLPSKTRRGWRGKVRPADATLAWRNAGFHVARGAMRWVFAIVCACLLGGTVGWGGGVCGFIVGWVVGALASRPSGRAPTHDAPSPRAAEPPRPPVVVQRPPEPPPILVQRPPEPPPVAAQRPPEPPVLLQRPPERVLPEQNPPARPFEIKVVLGTSAQHVPAPTHDARSKSKLTWYPPGRSLDVGDLQILGMVYTADRTLSWPGEPSAIVASLKVDPVAADPLEDFGYYPSYDRITPAQRRSYLEWLAAGRVDSDPARRSLGHLFLFFYGLERRVILERDRSSVLLEELICLLYHYGPTHRSRSLRSYFLQLVHFGGWQIGNAVYRELWPRALELDGERADAEGLRFVLANLYQCGETMDWSVAYRVALANEESRRSAVVSRAREQFWALFEQRFEERYPGGMVLRAGTRVATVAYRPSSYALVQMRYGQQKGVESLSVDLPDVAGVGGAVRGVATDVECVCRCTDGLQPRHRVEENG